MFDISDDEARLNERALFLRTAINNQNWDDIESELDDFCHERFGLKLEGIGICSFSVPVDYENVPDEMKITRKRGQKLSPPLYDWEDKYQVATLQVANHVLTLLESGQEGC